MQHADWFVAALMAAMMGSVLYGLWRARRGHVPFIRRIAGVAALDEAVERATEMGRPVVFGMGNGDIRSIEIHASLPVLAYVARLAARLRTPFTVLVRSPDVFPITEEVVRQAYVAEGVPDHFHPADQVQFLSSDSVIYSLGTARLIEEAKAGCAVFFGAFDFAALLMAEPGARMGVLQIAGDPSLFQIPFFVCTCDQTIIGEEYYAAGAYLSSEAGARATLRSQDLIKAVFALLILAGTLWLHVPKLLGTWLVDILKSYR